MSELNELGKALPSHPLPTREPTTEPTRFDRDTAVTPLSVAGESGHYEARIDPSWWIARGPNGGYLAAIILRACLHSVDDATRSPRSLTIHYASAPREGRVELSTTVERRGRSLTTVSARLSQAGKLIAIALTAASSPRADGFELHHAKVSDSAPEVVPATLVPPEQLPRSEQATTPFGQHFELRFLPGASPKIGSDTAVVAAWIRLREGRPVDYPLLAAYTDAFPPACFALDTESSRLGGFPTVDLNIHFHAALPQPNAASDDYSFGVFRTRIAHQGFAAEEGEIWSRDGVLLAQSRQLAVVMPGAES